MAVELSGTDVMENDATQGPSRAGAGLREAREHLGWKLPDVAEALCIRQDYLEAMETGDLKRLPAHAYRVGFIRSYARRLGLDDDEILRRFRDEGALEENRPANYILPSPLPDRAVPKSVMVVGGLAAIVVVLVVASHEYDTQKHMADTVPPVPASLAPLAAPPAPAPAVAPVVAPAVAPAPVTPAVTPAPVTPAAGAPAAPAPASPAAQPATPLPASGLVIATTGDAWVEVHDASGNILYSKVMHQGDTWPVPQEAGLTLTTGNAGVTEVVDNGKASAPLGTASQVLHNYQLTPPAPGAAPTAPVAAKPAASPPAAPAKPVAAAVPPSASPSKKDTP
jgi:cytoskeleton protein RodZ